MKWLGATAMAAICFWSSGFAGAQTAPGRGGDERVGDDLDPDLPADAARKLDPVVVIGRTSPVTVDERVVRFQAREMRDLFTHDPAIDIGGGSRNGQRIFLRGIEGSNLNITVDGARQGSNLYNHRGGMLNVDPEILKRVDVQAGPAAADQGFGALGGSIRFETIDAQDRLAPGEKVGGFVRGSYGSAANARRLGGGAYGLIGDNVGVLLYGSATNFDDLRIGGGFKVPFSGGDDNNILAKLSLVDIGPHTIRLSYERNDASGLNFQQRGDYPYQLQPADFRARPPQDQSLTRDTFTGRYRFNPDSVFIDLGLEAYNSKNDFFAPGSNGERFISEVTGGTIENTFRGEILGGRLETTVGADNFEDRGTASRTDAGTRYIKYTNFGLFLQNRLFWGESSVYAGVRNDMFSADYGPRKTDGDTTSFNVGGSLALAPGFSVFAGWGESARGFGTLPIHFARNAQPGLTFNGSATEDLRPETSEQTEVGIRWHADVGAGFIQALHADITAFRTEISDAVLYLQPGSGGLGGRPITDIYNFGETSTFEGAEAGFGIDFARGASTLRYAKVDLDNLPPDPQFIARAGAPRGDQLTWDTRFDLADGFSFGYVLRHVAELKSVPAGQIVYIPKPGYTLHDLQLSWQPEFLRGLALETSVTNLSDERYVAHPTLTQAGFATEEAGRDIRIALSYRF